MNKYGHDNPGLSLLQASDLASIQVNNDFQDDNEDHLDVQRLDQEVLQDFNDINAKIIFFKSWDAVMI